MKKLSKIFLIISGLFYLLTSIGLMLSTLFSLFVDRKYVFAIFDLLGFSNISISIIKPIFFILLLCLFILISLLTKRIFSSIKDKKHFLSNMFAGFFLLFTSIVGHVLLRDRIFIISYIINISLIIGSMLGLREKSIDYYKNNSSCKESNEESKNIDDENIRKEHKKDNSISKDEGKEIPKDNSLKRKDKKVNTLEDFKNKNDENKSSDALKYKKDESKTLNADKKEDNLHVLEDVKNNKKEIKE